ncbi:hypothetical protein FEM48_Zijuj07G0167000 [Ziziphus jujuba var. spinosa]|uniref:Disease resistance protein winged helix domain-containing protein n=1 Tax=Ziziphus jujuba var. spinosa TaxID=714518 RepID=A0A978V5S3_ZIZJJ|nr:hypothetical protein FEM48_Zijuj07G0167000 [Ziziphus jujuba var. spinosa]
MLVWLQLHLISLEVCQRIGCEEHIKVEPLSKNEAWELFTEKLGHGRALSPEIESIAKSLTEKCSGLPLGIKTIAGSMREVEDISEWRDALEKLKEPVAEHDDDIGIEVFQVLKYSYDQLKDPKVQQCFLYCSLFPEDYEIDRETLIEHFIDERFIDGLRSRQAELDRGHTMLNKLENVCLLEGGIKNFDRRKYVKMHDLVRSMAIQIGRDNFQYSVEAEEELTKILAEEERASKVSCMGKYIQCISPSSSSPKCLRLTTLILNGCVGLHIIPDCFFSHMPVLSVLDLSGTYIKNLPTSICQLLNLTALWLESCEVLESVPSLDKLKALRKLNLKGTAIREVPKGLEELSDLRYLNLEETRIKLIPSGILPKLSCLQYLGIDNEFGWEGSSPTLRYDDIENGWCEVASPSLQYEGIKNELGSEVSCPRQVRAEEIMKLRKLETFKGRLYDMDDFNKYVRWRENNKEDPNNYLLRVGSGILANGGGFTDYKKIVSLLECKISKSSRVEKTQTHWLCSLKMFSFCMLADAMMPAAYVILRH